MTPALLIGAGGMKISGISADRRSGFPVGVPPRWRGRFRIFPSRAMTLFSGIQHRARTGWKFRNDNKMGWVKKIAKFGRKGGRIPPVNKLIGETQNRAVAQPLVVGRTATNASGIEAGEGDLPSGGAAQGSGNTHISVWDQIVNWAQSKNNPDWRSDAFRRIYEQGELSEKDFQEIGLLLKTERGLENLGELKARRFCLGDTSGKNVPQHSVPTVQLASMGELVNVNAICSEKPLEFAPRGLTIVFGYNGSGKSGYNRVLKRACYARDSYATGDESPSILPDVRVFGAGNLQENPSAKFVLKVDGDDHSMDWHSGKRIADELNLPNSPIAVFDTHAASFYIVGDNEVPFRPYGLDIMERLAKACDVLRHSINADAEKVREQLRDLWDAYRGQGVPADAESRKYINRVRNLALSLNLNDIAQARDIAESVDHDRLKYLRGIFKDHEPATAARALREASKEISTWNTNFSVLVKTIGNDIQFRLRNAVESFAEASKIAQSEMDALDVPIVKSGSILWDAMFTAAEKFAKEIDSGNEFPNMRECVLCQQPMSDRNREMLIRLKKFVREDAGKIRDEKKGEMESICRELEEKNIKILLNKFSSLVIKSVATQVGHDFSALDNNMRKFVERLSEVKEHLLDSAKRCEWRDPPPLLTDPSEQITAICQLANKMAGDMENRASLKPEYEMLKSEDIFALNLGKIIEYVKLRLCSQDTDSSKISLETKKLSETPINDQLMRALKDEIDFLGGLPGKKILTRSHQSKAKQKARMIYAAKQEAETEQGNRDVSGKILTAVLSEGEQRMIALASFFAEISLSPDAVSSIVFDDPVSSLDHAYVRRFADRLRQEAQKRQVIVFTHDLYFSNLFKEKESNKVAVWRRENHPQPDSYGSVGAMPFNGRNIGERIAELKNEVSRIRALNDPSQQESPIRAEYVRLRETVEHLVETCLLQSMISRRTPDIKVGCVVSVFAHHKVKQDVARKAKELHDRASKINPRHKPASEMAGCPVSFSQFEDDVKMLDELRKKLAALQD